MPPRHAASIEAPRRHSAIDGTEHVPVNIINDRSTLLYLRIESPGATPQCNKLGGGSILIDSYDSSRFPRGHQFLSMHSLSATLLRKAIRILPTFSLCVNVVLFPTSPL